MSDPQPTPDDDEAPPLAAVLFGSISTLADTSELQRQAFNDAFEANGLGWRWERDDYVAMLEESGGEDRIARYASSMGQEVDAEAVHRTKSELFQRSLTDAPLAPRQGVVETIREAKGKGTKVGLVTTTAPANVAALLDALAPALEPGDFDVVVDATSVDTPKPDRASYSFALDRLGAPAEGSVAIEDNRGGVDAAMAAGVACVAFPNQNTAGHDFGAATGRVDQIDLVGLEQLVASR